jgi:hypothetical protein
MVPTSQLSRTFYRKMFEPIRKLGPAAIPRMPLEVPSIRARCTTSPPAERQLHQRIGTLERRMSRSASISHAANSSSAAVTVSASAKGPRMTPEIFFLTSSL